MRRLRLHAGPQLGHFDAGSFDGQHGHFEKGLSHILVHVVEVRLLAGNFGAQAGQFLLVRLLLLCERGEELFLMRLAFRAERFLHLIDAASQRVL